MIEKRIHPTKPRKKKVALRSSMGAGILCAVAVLVMLTRGISVQPGINADNERISELKLQIENATAQKEEVDRLSQSSESDEFKIKVARDKLGFVNKDEIVFYDIAEK